MANSQYEYVKNFEMPDPLNPCMFAVIRVDGHAFTKWVDPQRS
jgi:tRNA(His) guanylyltransferase